MTTIYSDDPHNIELKRIGLPRDMTYEVTTYGYGDLATSDLRWYSKKMDTADSCRITSWDTGAWTRIDTKMIETHTISQKKI
jgi:hypothetical protein